MTHPTLPGQPHIAYRDQQLFAEGVSTSDLARQYATPLFVYSKAAMVGALAACGQRGPLYLPTDAAAKNRATLPQTATPQLPGSAAPTPSATPVTPTPATPSPAAP